MSLDDDPLCDDDFYDEEDYIREEEPYYVPEWLSAPYGKVVMQKKSSLSPVKSVVSSSTTVTQVGSGLPSSGPPGSGFPRSTDFSGMLPPLPDPSLPPVNKPVDNNLWYRYYKTVISSGLPVTPYDIRTLIESISASNILIDAQSPYGPDALYGPFGLENPLNNRNPLSPNNPSSQYSPFNQDSELNPSNPHSLLNPYNPESILSPNNPNSPFSPDNLDYPFFDVNNILSLFNPNNMRSPFNPLNPLSPFSPNNPRSPFYQRYDFEFYTLNTDSPFSPLNPISPLSPINPSSPYNPLNKNSIFNMFNPASPYNINNPDSPLNPASPNYYKTFTGPVTLPLDSPYASPYERTTREEVIENILRNPDSPFNVNSPLSPFNPYSYRSLLNPNNPSSILNPLNPDSILSPLNPLSPYNPQSTKISYYNVKPYDSLFNPNNPQSIFHTANPDSPFNTLNPRSPFYDHRDTINSHLNPNNPNSPLSPLNPDSVLSPLNPASPFHPQNPRSLYYPQNPISPYYQQHINSFFSRKTVSDAPYYDVNSPYSPVSPFNPRSLLNPNNPESPLSPLNPQSPFSPLNPTSPFNVIHENTSPFESTHKSSLFNPHNPESPYNPQNPHSLLNPDNPQSPFFGDYEIKNSPLNPQNPNSILSPYNSKSLLSPLNPASPYSSKLVDSIYNPQYPYSPYYFETSLKYFDSHESSYTSLTQVDISSPHSPYNPNTVDSLLNPNNPASPLNPSNPDSPLNPFNPLSPFYKYKAVTPIYYTSSPHSLFNPNNPKSPFNPENPDSPLNTNNPSSPFYNDYQVKNSPLNPVNPDSILSPYNPASPLSPLNPSSPYNPNNINSLYNPQNPISLYHSGNPNSPYYYKSKLVQDKIYPPYNSLYNPNNVNSLLNPLNPNSLLSPFNPASIFYKDSLSSKFSDYLIEKQIFDANNPLSIFNPNNPASPFNPENPQSVFNPRNPNSPFRDTNPLSLENPQNPNSPYSPYNPDSLNSPLHPSSPYNPQNFDSIYHPNNPSSPYSSNSQVSSSYRSLHQKSYQPQYVKSVLNVDYQNVLDNSPYSPTNPTSLYNPTNPLSPFHPDSPFNPTNILSAYHPNSFFNPSNPDSIFNTNSIFNPANPRSPFNPHSPIYQDTPLYNPTSLYNALNPLSPFHRDTLLNPLNPESPFNPNSPLHPSNPAYLFNNGNPLSPLDNPLYDASNPLSPFYPASLLNPLNPNSPFHPQSPYNPYNLDSPFHESNPLNPANNPLLNNAFSNLSPDLREYFKNPDSIVYENQKSMYSPIAPFYQYDSRHNTFYLDYIKYIYDLYGCEFPYEQLFFPYAPIDRQKFIDYLKTQYKDEVPPFWPYQRYQYYLPRSIISDTQYHLSNVYGENNPLGKDIPFGPYIPDNNDLYYKFIKYINNKFGSYFNYDSLLFSYAPPKDRVQFYTFLKSKYEECPDLWPYEVDYWNDCSKFSNFSYPLNLYQTRTVLPGQYPISPESPISPFFEYDEKYNDLYYDYLKYINDIYGPTFPFDQIIFPHNPYSRDRFIAYLKTQCKDKPNFWPYYDYLWKCPDKFYIYDREAALSTIYNPLVRDGPLGPYIPKYKDLYVKYIKYINTLYGPNYPYERLLFPEASYKVRVEFVKCLKDQFSKLPPFWPYPQSFWDKPELIPSTNNIFEIEEDINMDERQIRLSKSITSIGYPLAENSPFYHYDPDCNKLYVDYSNYIADIYGNNFPFSKLMFPYDTQGRSAFIKYLKTQPNCTDKAPKYWPYYPFEYLYYSDSVSLQDFRNLDYPSDFIPPFGPYLSKYNQLYADYIKYIHKHFNRDYRYETLLFPYANVEDRIAFVTYLKSQLNTCPEFWPYTTDIWNVPDRIKTMIFDVRSLYLNPLNPSAVVNLPLPEINPLADVHNPQSPLNPKNPDSPFNPSNPQSPLSPYNTNSLLSPLNPTSLFYVSNPARPLHHLSPLSLYNPDNPLSPFNSENPNSIFNPNNPLSPFYNNYPIKNSVLNPQNPDSILSPFNLFSPLSPKNPASPYNPDCSDSPYNSQNPLSPYYHESYTTYSTKYTTNEDLYRSGPVYDLNSPNSPYSPYNPTSLLNPNNPNSLLNPRSPLSPLSPDNPNSPFYFDDLQSPIFDSYSKFSYFNPNNIKSPFNPKNPDSPFNPNNPQSLFYDDYQVKNTQLNPLNPKSILSPYNSHSLLSPLNPASPYNPACLDSIYNLKNVNFYYNNRFRSTNHYSQVPVDVYYQEGLVNPSHPFNPFNPESILNPSNPSSPLSPYNPDSILNPKNPDSPLYSYNSRASIYDANNPRSLLNPYHPESPFNPDNPLSIYNPNHPLYPFKESSYIYSTLNPESPYSPLNSDSIYSPLNPTSVFNPKCADSIYNSNNPYSPYSIDHTSSVYSTSIMQKTSSKQIVNSVFGTEVYSSQISIDDFQNPKSPFNPRNPLSPYNLQSPFNPSNPLSPFNPHSLFNPSNPESPLNPLSPLNPDNFNSPFNPNSPLYPGTPFFCSTSLFNALNSDSPFNKNSLLNPHNPNSPFNVNSPLNPLQTNYYFNQRSLLTTDLYDNPLLDSLNPTSPFNLNSVLNPENPDSPFSQYSQFNPKNPESPYNPFNLYSPLNPSNPNSPLNPNYVPSKITTTEDYLSQSIVPDNIITSPYDLLYRKNPFYQNSKIKSFNAIEHVSEYYRLNPYKYPKGPYSITEPFDKYNDKFSPLYLEYLKYIIAKYGDNFPYEQLLFPYDKEARVTYVKNLKTCFTSEDAPSWFPYAEKYWTNPEDLTDISTLVIQYGPYNPLGFKAPFGDYDEKFNDLYYNYLLYKIESCESNYNFEALLFPHCPTSSLNYIDFLKTKYNEKPDWWPYTAANWNYPYLLYTESFIEKALFVSDLERRTITIDPSSPYSNIAPFYKYDCKYNELYLDYVKFIHSLFGCNFPYEQLFFEYAPQDRKKFIEYVKSQYKDKIPPFWPYSGYQWILPNSLITGESFTPVRPYGADNPLGREVPFGPYLPEFKDLYCKYLKYINEKFGPYFEYDQLLFSYLSPKERVDYYTILKSKYEKQPSFWPYSSDSWTDVSLISHIPYRSLDLSLPLVLDPVYLPDPSSLFAPFYKYDSKYNDFYYDYIKCTYDIYGKDYPYERLLFSYNPRDRETFLKYLSSKCGEDVPDFWPYYPLLWKHGDKFVKYGSTVREITVSEPVLRSGIFGAYIPKHNEMYVKYIKYVNERYGPRFSYDMLFFPNSPLKDRVDFINYIKNQYPDKCPDYWPYPKIFWDKPDQITIVSKELGQLSMIDYNPYNTILPEGPFYKYNTEYNELYVKYLELIYELYGDDFPYSRLYFPYDIQSRSTFIQYLKTLPECKDKAPKYWSNYPYEFQAYSDSLILSDYKKIDIPSDFIEPFGPYIPKYKEFYVNYIKYINKEFGPNYPYESLLFPYASVEDRIEFINYLKSQFDKCPEYLPFLINIWTKPDVLKEIQKISLPIDDRIMLPYNPTGVVPYSNVDDIFNPFSPLNPNSAYSPYNKDSLFDNTNPDSLLNPYNPQSSLSPMNPLSPFYPNNPNDVIFDSSNPASPFNPYNPDSYFNPKNPKSLFNPTSPDSPYFNQYQYLYSPISPFNARSLFSPLNPLSPLSSLNSDSPYNPDNPNSIYNIENPFSPYNTLNPKSPLNPNSPFFYRKLPAPSVINSIVTDYFSNPYDIVDSYLCPTNVASELSPLNTNSLLSPFNPSSPLSPENPGSPFNPYNPSITIFNSQNEYSLFNPYNGYSPFNPLHPKSPFNPDNPDSPFGSYPQYSQLNPQHPNSLLSPLNKRSLYNPQNPNSLYNPKNKESLYNPGNPASPYNWEQTIDTSLVSTQYLSNSPFKASEYYRTVATGLPYVPNSPVFDPFYPDNPLLLRPSPFNAIAPFEEFIPKYQDLYLKYICYIEEIYGDFPFEQLFFPYNVEARLQFILFLKTKYRTDAPSFWPYYPIEWKNPALIHDIYEPNPFGLSNPLKAMSPFGPYFEKYNELYYNYTEMIYETHGLNYPYRFLLFPYSPKDRLCYINYLKTLCKAIPKWWPYSIDDWNNPNKMFDYINYPERVVLPSVPSRYLDPYLSNYGDPSRWELQVPFANDLPFPNSPVAPFGPYDPKYNDLYYQYIKYICKTYGDFFPFEQILFPYNVQARNDLIAFIKTQEKEKPSYWPFLAYQWENPLAIPLSTYCTNIPYGSINPLGDRAPFGPYLPEFNELYCKYIDYMYKKYGDVYPFEKLLFAYSPADQVTFLKYLSSHYDKCPGWWPYSDEEWTTGNIRTRSLLNPLYAPTYPTLDVINNGMVPIDEVLEGTSPLTSPYGPFYSYNSKYNDLYEEYTRMLFDLYSNGFPYDQVLFPYSPDDTVTYVQYLKTKYTKQPDFWPLFPYQWDRPDKIQEYPLRLRSLEVQESFNGQIPFGPYQDKYNEVYYKYIEYIYCSFGLNYPYEDLLFPYDPINRVTFSKFLKTKCDKMPNWWPYGKFIWDNPEKFYTLPQTSYAYNYLADKSSLSQYRNYVFGLTDFVPYNPLGKFTPFGFYSPEYNELYKSFIEYTFYKFGRNFPYDNLLFPDNPTARYQFIHYLKTTCKTGQPDYWPFTKRNWNEPLTLDFSPISERSIFLPNEDPLGPYGPFGSYCSDYNKLYKDYIEYIYERNGDSYAYDSLLFPYSKTDRIAFIKYLKSCSSSCPGWWPYPDEAWNSPELIDTYPYPYPGKPYPDYLVDIPFKRSNLATSPLALYGPLGEYKSKSNDLYYKYITYIYKRNGLNYPYELVLFPADPAEKRIEFITYLKSVCKEIPPWWPYSSEVWTNCELLKCVHNVGPYTLGPFAPFGHYSCEYDSLYKDYIENVYSIYGNSIAYDTFMFPYEPLSRFKFSKYLGTVYKNGCPDWFIFGSDYWNDVQVYWGNKPKPVTPALPVVDPGTPNMRSLLGALDTLNPAVVPDPSVEDLSKFQGSYEFWEKYSPYKFDKNGLYQVSLFQTFLEGLEKERYNIYRSVIYPPDMTPYVKSGDCFDIVIVGASAAGCVLANRLSEVTSWKILLIEAGGDQPIQSRVPGLSATLALSDYDNGYLAEPSQFAGLGVQDGRIRISSGKSLGGSSAVQNILYQRGTSFDYENFGNLGLDGWGYDETLKYFVKSEDYRSVIYNESIAVHGTEGYLPVKLFKNKENNLIRELLESSAQELGYPTPKDMNDRYADVGFAELPGTIRYGLRFTAADAYLTPITGKRRNLYVVKRSKVTKIIIDDNNVAKGVEYTNSKGEKITITATKEVILTAGAIGNAKLLLLSGVGPKDDLAKFNIPCKQELRVGENLKLSAQFTGPVMGFSTPLKRTLYSQELVFKYLINRMGPLSNIGLWSFTGYIDTLRNTARPDLEIHLLYFQQNDVRKMCKIKRAYNFNADVQTAYVNMNQKTDMAVFSLSLVNPKSCGKVSLTSADPLAPPLIDTGLLSDPEDLGTLMRGTDYVSRLEQTAAIRLAGGTLMSLNLDACSQYPWRSTQCWTCYIRQLTTTSSNPVGTVMMGSASDPNAVVTPDLCVKGIKGLRVADASVLPNAIITQSDAISYMIGEKCSDSVKVKYNIPI